MEKHCFVMRLLYLKYNSHLFNSVNYYCRVNNFMAYITHRLRIL